MPEHTREDAEKVRKGLGWTVGGVGKQGYEKWLCPCGAHKKWIHKTPSNPNYFKDAIAYMRRQSCQNP